LKKIYGPYTRKDGRRILVLSKEDGSRTTKSYPRQLMESKLGRELSDDETVDHVDRNLLNEDEDNLQILSVVENSEKSALRRKDVHSNCVFCGTFFKLSVTQVRNRSRKKAGPFCSRSCAGTYGASVQNNKVDRLPENNIVVEYFRNDD